MGGSAGCRGKRCGRHLERGCGWGAARAGGGSKGEGDVPHFVLTVGTAFQA